MRGQRGASNLAKAGDDVDDSRWYACLFDELGKVESGKRGLLGGLENNGISSGNSGANLPRQHEKREVPRDDLSANTNLEESAHAYTSVSDMELTGSCFV